MRWLPLLILGMGLIVPGLVRAENPSGARMEGPRGQIIFRPAGTNASPGFIFGPVIDPSQLTDEQVTDAIKKGVDYLMDHRKDPTLWIPNAPRQRPEVALQTYTFLLLGQTLDDPRLSPNSDELKTHIYFILHTKPASTYLAGMQASALALLPKSVERDEALKACKSYLVRAQDGGAYSYTMNSDLPWDNSNSQYGVLGGWALFDAEIELPNAFWDAVAQHWRKTQKQNGGWSYLERDATSDSMTAAGLASLYVTADVLDQEVRADPKDDKQIDDGLANLVRHFDPAKPDLYYLYGVERVGLASGLKFFGNTDWYKTTAAVLVAEQQDDGHWASSFPGSLDRISTALALLFLARGRNPVLFNKLQYDGPWNARPRDDANLTAWMSKTFERAMNWQVVNLHVPANELLDAPVLFITGHADPNFSVEDLKKIRAFIYAGGIVFSNAEGNSVEFTSAMKAYAGIVLDHRYEFRVLPADHTLYNIQFKIKNPPLILGMSNGSRELWIHSTVDLSATWQGRRRTEADNWNIPANLYFYATGKGSLRSKLQSLVVPETTRPPKRQVRVARVRYAGNWNPEPGAWPRFARTAMRDFATELDISERNISDLDATKTPVAHITGTAAFSLPADDMAKLKAYLEQGGTLIADSTGGGEAFGKSMDELAQALFSGEHFARVPTDDPILTPARPDMVTIFPAAYRKYSNAEFGRSDQPNLEVLMHNGRPMIYFSPVDITSGLLGTATWGIHGYAPASAQAMARNLILYAGSLNTTADKTSAAGAKGE